MSFQFQHLGQDGATIAKVDATSNAARGTLYDAAGNVISAANKAAIVPTTQPGLQLSGADYKVSRLLRVSSNGTLRTSDDTLMLYDSVEGAAYDSNKWVQTLTTMTVTQATGAITFNAGNSFATTVGAMHVSHRLFQNVPRSALTYRTKARHTAHFANNQIQMGFGVPTAVTAVAFLNGALWRKDGTGQYIPVVSMNGSEQLGTPISNATFIASVPTTDYAWFEVFLEDTRATFRIYTMGGALVNEQTLEFTPAIIGFAATHLAAVHHICNTGATGTAVQMLVAGTSVFAGDSLSGIPYDVIQAAQNYGSLTSPTAYTQTANYANTAAPASATLSNTAAGYTTLGGQWQFAAVGGAETDYCLFGFQVPTPYALVVKGVTIHAFNMVVAVATTAHSLHWGLGFNSSAVSLATAAPYPYMRKAIGQMFIPTGGVVGQSFNTPVTWEGTEVVQPGRFFAIILKMPTATATATQIIRGTAVVNGFFK
jgi:hypothetical protein